MCLLLIHKKRPSCGGPYPNSTSTSATKQVPDLKKTQLLWLLVPLLPWNIVFRIKNSCILQECQCMLPVLASNAHNACGVDDDVCFDVFFLTSSTNSMTNGQTYFKIKTLPSHYIYVDNVHSKYPNKPLGQIEVFFNHPFFCQWLLLSPWAVGRGSSPHVQVMSMRWDLFPNAFAEPAKKQNHGQNLATFKYMFLGFWSESTSENLCFVSHKTNGF